jgi:mRNA interferase RelE/StbE
MAACGISPSLEKRILNNTNPRSLGDAFKGSLNSYWRYRVRGYRILCILENETVTVHVMQTGYHREIYQ